MDYFQCLESCRKLVNAECECNNTTLIDFLNYTPWYVWFALVVVLGFILGTIWTLWHFKGVYD